VRVKGLKSLPCAQFVPYPYLDLGLSLRCLNCFLFGRPSDACNLTIASFLSGDTFNAGFIYLYLRGAPQALKCGCHQEAWRHE
jgi:hypothetical protein